MVHRGRRWRALLLGSRVGAGLPVRCGLHTGAGGPASVVVVQAGGPIGDRGEAELESEQEFCGRVDPDHSGGRRWAPVPRGEFCTGQRTQSSRRAAGSTRWDVILSRLSCAVVVQGMYRSSCAWAGLTWVRSRRRWPRFDPGRLHCCRAAPSPREVFFLPGSPDGSRTEADVPARSPNASGNRSAARALTGAGAHRRGSFGAGWSDSLSRRAGGGTALLEATRRREMPGRMGSKAGVRASGGVGQ